MKITRILQEPLKTGSRFLSFSLTLALALMFALSSSVFAEKSSESDKSKQSTAEESEKSESATEINWRNYEDGVKLAKESGKQIVIDFSTAWCGYCKKMDRETFTDTKVIEYISENFIAVKVDGDSKREFEIDGFATTEKRLTKEMYGVSGYPTFWFLESDGSKIGKQPGYQPAQSFLELLAFVTEKKYLEQTKGSGAGQGQ